MIWVLIIFGIPLVVIPFIIISLETSSANIDEQRRKRRESKLSNLKELDEELYDVKYTDTDIKTSNGWRTEHKRVYAKVRCRCKSCGTVYSMKLTNCPNCGSVEHI